MQFDSDSLGNNMELGFPSDLQSFGLVAFGAAMLFLIASGRVFTKTNVDRMLQDKDKVIDQQAEIIRILLNNGVKPTEKLLTTMRENVSGGGDGT